MCLLISENFQVLTSYKSLAPTLPAHNCSCAPCFPNSPKVSCFRRFEISYYFLLHQSHSYLFFIPCLCIFFKIAAQTKIVPLSLMMICGLPSLLTNPVIAIKAGASFTAGFQTKNASTSVLFRIATLRQQCCGVSFCSTRHSPVITINNMKRLHPRKAIIAFLQLSTFFPKDTQIELLQEVWIVNWLFVAPIAQWSFLYPFLVHILQTRRANKNCPFVAHDDVRFASYITEACYFHQGCVRVQVLSQFLC